MAVLGGVLLLLAGTGRLLCLHLLMLSLPLPQALGLDAELLQLASVIGRRADHVSPRLDGAEDEVRRQHLQHRLQVRGHLDRNTAQPASQRLLCCCCALQRLASVWLACSQTRSSASSSPRLAIECCRLGAAPLPRSFSASKLEQPTCQTQRTCPFS